MSAAPSGSGPDLRIVLPAKFESQRGIDMQVGFIGRGQMGAGMAARLLKAGHAVTVYNRTPDKAHGLTAQGAEVLS